MEDNKKNDGLDGMVALLNLCESDPDGGLESIKSITSKNPEFSNNLFLRFSKAIAYKSKVFQALKNKSNLAENIGSMGSVAAITEKIQPLLTKDDVKYLELALTEFRQIIDVDPEFISTISTDEDPKGEATLAMICYLLESCKPGAVQEILNQTSLSYFGRDRIKVMPNISSLEPQILRPFTEVKFTVNSIAKSAVLANYDTDIKGRNYIMCLLYQRLIDDLGEDETFDDAIYIDTVYLFDDNTFAYDLEKLEQTESQKNKKKGFFKKLFS